jgi:hypothetical protein
MSRAFEQTYMRELKRSSTKSSVLLGLSRDEPTLRGRFFSVLGPAFLVMAALQITAGDMVAAGVDTAIGALAIWASE